MFQIEHEDERALVEAQLLGWRKEQRQLMLRADAQLSMKEALGRCNEEALKAFEQGLEECAFQIRYHEQILAAQLPTPDAATAPRRTNGVHA